MNVDFFETDCAEMPINNTLFGICDDQNSLKAYTNTSDSTKWVAKVINDTEIDVTFIAIDNCLNIYKENTKDKESTCDGMLTFVNSLYLVELKEKGKGGWITEAKGQLENTIKLLAENHNLTDFRYKKAYACNKKHPTFTVIDVAEKKSFFERTKGFRLDVQAEIVIK